MFQKDCGDNLLVGKGYLLNAIVPSRIFGMHFSEKCPKRYQRNLHAH